jgi:hypothetical protein
MISVLQTPCQSLQRGSLKAFLKKEKTERQNISVFNHYMENGQFNPPPNYYHHIDSIFQVRNSSALNQKELALSSKSCKPAMGP